MGLDISSPPCEERTRGQLLALRNAGNLVPGGHYVVTDYNRANVGAARIKLHATATNRLTLDAMVETTFDNAAWVGRYDLDTARITALQDNRGNDVSGQVGVEVDRFDWGNTSLTEVTVKNADLYTDVGSAFRITSSEFSNLSQADFRGATGYFLNGSVKDGAQIQADNATNFRALGSTMDSRALIYAENSTNVTFQYSQMSSNGQWNVRAQTDGRLYYSSIAGNAYVRYAGGTRQWIYYSSFDGRGSLNQFAGIVQVYYSHFDSYGEFRNEAGAGSALIYGFHLESRAYVRNYNTNRVRVYYSSVESRGEIQFRDAADFRYYYSSSSGYGLLVTSGTATLAYGMEITSRAVIRLTGGTHYYDTFAAQANFTTAFNTRYVTGHGRFVQTATAANSSKGRNYFNNTIV